MRNEMRNKMPEEMLRTTGKYGLVLCHDRTRSFSRVCHTALHTHCVAWSGADWSRNMPDAENALI